MMDEYQEKLKKCGLSLRQHQLSGVETVLSWRKEQHGGIIADEMGLGKTCEAVSLISILTNTDKLRPHLVVCPLSVIDHWEKELARFGCGELQIIKFMGDLEERLKLSRKMMTSKEWDVVLTTYDYVQIEGSPILKFHWASLVFDEAQRIKNTNSKLHSAILELHVDWIVLMTGTPIQNKMQELFALLCIIDKNKFPLENLETFVKKYSQTDEDKVIKELRTILSKYMIRRLKSEIAIEIPPSSQVVLYHGLSSMQKDLYRAILSKNYRFLMNATSRQGDCEGSNKNSLVNIMMQLRKCALHPYLFNGMEPEPFEEGEHLATTSGKMMLLERLLVFLHKRKHRVLLFSQMTNMLDIVQDLLNFRGWSFERLDGKLKADMRFAAIDNFQKSDCIFCFLLSTRAGGLGLTLTRADTVIFIDSDFNPQNDIQAAARCHRIGQTKHVKIIRLVAKNTVEDVIECYATRKLRMTNRVMESDANVRKEKLTAVELSNMILYGLQHLNDEDGYSSKRVLTEEEIEKIVGETDADGNWIGDDTEAAAQQLDENVEPVVGKVPSVAEEAPSIYVFEGHDYKKDQEALESIIEEAKTKGIENKRKAETSRVRRLLRTKEEMEELRKRNLERQQKSKQDRLHKMEEKKTKLWAEHGYMSTVLPMPEQVEDETGEELDEESAIYYGPYFVHGDVTHPWRASHDHSKRAIIVHVVDNSGSFGRGGVFDALRAKSARVADAYRLASEMNDLHIGDAHLIEDIDETEEHSSTDGSVTGDEENLASEQLTSSGITWKRKESVVLLVAQSRRNRNEILDKPFVECLTRLAAYAKSHNSTSVHFPRLGYGMTNINWYSMEHMIRRHLTDRRIHTYVYYHTGKMRIQQRNVHVQKKTDEAGEAEVRRANKAESSDFVRGNGLGTRETLKLYDQDKEGSLQSEGDDESVEGGDLGEERAEQTEEDRIEEQAWESESEEGDYSRRKRRRVERLFERMVIWVHSLPVSERQHYTTLVEEHGGDAIEEKDGTDLVTHALFDEMMLDGIEELKNLKDALPEGCVIVSKEWVDQSVNIGKAIDTKSFLV